jgi:hypothetical protein
MGDTEIQHQMHRARLIRKVSRELDVPTLLTPTFNDLLCFYDGRLVRLIEISCNHKSQAASLQSLGSGRPWRWKRMSAKDSRPGFVSVVHLAKTVKKIFRKKKQPKPYYRTPFA